MSEHASKKRVKVVVDEDSILDTPLHFVNHVALRATEEEIFMTLFVRQDNLGRIEEDEFVVPIQPVAQVVTHPAHARRWAKLILEHLGEEDGK